MKTYRFETQSHKGLQPYFILTGVHPSEINIDHMSMLRMTQLTPDQFEELRIAGDVPQHLPGTQNYSLSEVCGWIEDHLDNTKRAE